MYPYTWAVVLLYIFLYSKRGPMAPARPGPADSASAWRDHCTPSGLLSPQRQGAQRRARNLNRSPSPPKPVPLDSPKSVRMSDRLLASEGMVDQLTAQVIDLRSKVLVSSGKLKHDEGALLLEQIEAILRKQRELQELTHQLSQENTILRSQVRDTVGNTLPEPLSPSRRSAAALPKGVSSMAAPAGPSHADVMEEFVRSGKRAHGCSRVRAREIICRPCAAKRMTPFAVPALSLPRQEAACRPCHAKPTFGNCITQWESRSYATHTSRALRVGVAMRVTLRVPVRSGRMQRAEPAVA